MAPERQAASPLLDSFRADGFVTHPAVLSDGFRRVVLAYTKECEAKQIAAFEAATGWSPRDAATVGGPDPADALAGDRDLLATLRGSVRTADRLDPRLHALADEVALLDLAKTLLQTDRIRLHWPVMLRFKLPNVSASIIHLHQDWAYNDWVDEFVNIWIPLVDIDEAIGGVDVLPGSHRAGRFTHNIQGFGDPVAQVTPDLPDATTHINLKAGGALAFAQNLLHASHPNTSDRIRYSMEVRCFAADRISTKHSFDPMTRSVVLPQMAG